MHDQDPKQQLIESQDTDQRQKKSDGSSQPGQTSMSPPTVDPVSASYKSATSINKSVPTALQISTQGEQDEETIIQEDNSMFLKKLQIEINVDEL